MGLGIPMGEELNFREANAKEKRSLPVHWLREMSFFSSEPTVHQDFPCKEVPVTGQEGASLE